VFKKELIKVSNFERVLLNIEIAINRKNLNSIIENSNELLDPLVQNQSKKLDELINQYYNLMDPKKTSSNIDGVFFN
jgi:tetrahydromethanopterin S-methyltransferase subunit B